MADAFKEGDIQSIYKLLLTAPTATGDIILGKVMGSILDQRDINNDQLAIVNLVRQYYSPYGGFLEEVKNKNIARLPTVQRAIGIIANGSRYEQSVLRPFVNRTEGSIQKIINVSALFNSEEKIRDALLNDIELSVLFQEAKYRDITVETNVLYNGQKVTKFTKENVKLNGGILVIQTQKYEGDSFELFKKLYRNPVMLRGFFKGIGNLFTKAKDLLFYHGDPKPQNIVFRKQDTNYEFKFIDFEYSIVYVNKVPVGNTFLIERDNFLSEKFPRFESNIANQWHYNRNIEKNFDGVQRGEIRCFNIDFLTIIMWFIQYQSEKLMTEQTVLSNLNAIFIEFIKLVNYRQDNSTSLSEKFVDLI
jgi:hypothetical protein